MIILAADYFRCSPNLFLTLLHSEQPKLQRVLAFPSAIEFWPF